MTTNINGQRNNVQLLTNLICIRIVWDMSIISKERRCGNNHFCSSLDTYCSASAAIKSSNLSMLLNTILIFPFGISRAPGSSPHVPDLLLNRKSIVILRVYLKEVNIKEDGFLGARNLDLILFFFWVSETLILVPITFIRTQYTYLI